MSKKPYFLITIDTEGDNLWQNHDHITTENAQFLPRFQALCEQYSFKPTYVTNYEMAIDPHYQEFARDVIKRNQGEVGTHCHAWNSPPIHHISDNDFLHKNYLIDYPTEIMREKFIYLHKLLEDTFSVPMKSHRSGRWALNSEYIQLLDEFGYWVDCSVTPHQNWAFTPGAPKEVGGKGGTDYSHFPEQAYFMDTNNIHLSGSSSLLQVPMSVRLKYAPWVQSLKSGINKLRGKNRPPRTIWLRPKGGNAEAMCQLAQQILDQGNDYVEFMLHSSEFMPSGSPTFKDAASIEGLYQDLETLFTHLSEKTQGATLSEYYLVKCEEQGKEPNQKK